MKKHFLFIFISLIILNFSCIKEKTLHDLKYQQIYTYIQQTGLVFDTTRSGFFIHTNFKGINNFNKGDVVHLVYTAIYLDPNYNGNHVTFAENDTFMFRIGNREILDAWNEIADNFGEGGSGIAILPFDKAYNKEHTPTIPPYSNIVYFFRFYSNNYRVDQLSKFYEYAQQYDTMSVIYNDTLIYAKYYDIGQELIANDGIKLDFNLYTIEDSLLQESYNFFINPSTNDAMPPGFIEAILNMTYGEMGKIIIPPGLSYDSDDNIYNIPAYSALYAEVRTIPDSMELNQTSKIYKYLYLNGATPDSILPNGVYYFRNKLGELPKAYYGATISYSDSLYILDNDIPFESCQGCSKKLNSSNFLPGQLSGIQLMKTGGEATFIIPYQQGYGSVWHGNVPPYSTLIYKIKLTNVD